MQTLLAVTLFVILTACMSLEPRADKAMLICDWKDKWMARKESDDNMTVKKYKQTKLPPTAQPVRDGGKIYEYPEKLEYLVNLQIRVEMNAFYNYMSMSRFFHKYDQDRQGFAKYFRASAMEEMEHAEAFMKYQQMRGGDVELYNLPAPAKRDWRDAKDVLQTAFDLEKNVTDEVLCLHHLAVEKFQDADFENFLSEKIIPEQYESMKELKTHIKNLERACPLKEKVQCDLYPLYEMQYDMKLNK